MAASVLVIIGPPGAGKTTQSEILAKRLNGVHISAGDVLRRKGGALVQESVRRGHLVESKVAEELVGAEIAQVPENKIIILDGITRKLQEAKWLDRFLVDLNRPIDRVIFIDLHQPLAVERNIARGRHDDKLETQMLRWELYQAETVPVLDYYTEKGLISRIDGSGSVEDVSKKIGALLEK